MIVFFREEKLADLKKTSFWLPCFQPEKTETVSVVVDKLVVCTLLHDVVVFISSSDYYLLLWVVICYTVFISNCFVNCGYVATVYG